MTDCTERSEGREGMTNGLRSRDDPSGSRGRPGTGIRFPVCDGDRTFGADALAEPAEEVGSVLVVVAASRRPEASA
jgi:hypothetical protein